MALGDFDGEVRATGRWLYDGESWREALVIAFDCDFYRDRLPYGDGEDRAAYPLNSDGELLYLRVDGELLAKPFSSLAEARAWAHEQPWGPVTWAD